MSYDPRTNAETVDAMMRGRFAIVQGSQGHRAGLDAMLLAATVPTDATGRLLDLGAGCGTVAFAALTRAPKLTATLVEREPELCERCERALRLPENAHLLGRVEIVVQAVENFRPSRPFDHALANPPYNPSQMQPSPDDGRARAHMEKPGELASWRDAASRCLRTGGQAAFILRPSAWPHADLGPRFGDQQLLPVVPRAGEAASRIILLARKGRRTQASVGAPVVVHEADGAFTQRVSALLDGECGLFEHPAPL